MSPISEHFAAVAAQFTRRARAVSDGAWDNPAPCEGWTARDVVRHMVDQPLGFPHRLWPAGHDVGDDGREVVEPRADPLLDKRVEGGRGIGDFAVEFTESETVADAATDGLASTGTAVGRWICRRSSESAVPARMKWMADRTGPPLTGTTLMIPCTPNASVTVAQPVRGSTFDQAPACFCWTGPSQSWPPNPSGPNWSATGSRSIPTSWLPRSSVGRG